FSKGYFGFDILGAIPFHRPTKWVQYRVNEKLTTGLSSFCRTTRYKPPFRHEAESLKRQQHYISTRNLKIHGIA
ncbi:hypothetical protein, partial [Escherichia coli]|uniref:hypothetical protein n=1 Tax=Escherichia coli TaxID=562 RepID=UPI001F49FAFE